MTIKNNEDFHAHPRSWINPKIEMKESTIEGKGFIAVEKVLKNENLIVQSGQCVHISRIDQTSMEPFWYYGFQIEKDIYYYPTLRDGEPFLDGIFRINHSCEPNAGFRGQITLVAMRDIEPGEEVTYDYAMTDVETSLEDSWVPEECHCGCLTCRGKITGNDWRMPELQEKYRGYFSTYVTECIKNGM